MRHISTSHQWSGILKSYAKITIENTNMPNCNERVNYGLLNLKGHMNIVVGFGYPILTLDSTVHLIAQQQFKM